MNLNDRYGVGLAYITNATYNIDPNTGYANLNVTLNSQSVPGDDAYSIPHSFPFGHFSIPPDNTYAVVANIAGTTMSPIALGNIPNYDNLYIFSALGIGESCIYSYLPGMNNYSLSAKIDGLKAYIKNSLGTNPATMLWGENIVKVLLDILSYLSDSNNVLSNLITYFNNHTHGDPAGPGLTPGTNDPDTIPYPPALTTDQTDLEDGKGYVNDTGEPM